MPYGGGNFSAVTPLAEAVKPKYGSNFSAVVPYGGNFSAASSFSFFSGNVNGDSKLGGSYMFSVPERTANLFSDG